MVKNFDRFLGDEAGFRCWLFRIACNEVNTFYRKAARHQSALDAVRQETSEPTALPEQPDDEENQARIDFLRNAIAGLKPEHQDIITLRYFQGLNSEQIGEVLELNPATVRSRLSRSLKLLKKEYRLHQQETAGEWPF